MHLWLGIPAGGFARGPDKYFQEGGKCRRKLTAELKRRKDMVISRDISEHYGGDCSQA